MLQPSLVGHEWLVPDQAVPCEVVTDEEDFEAELMWRAPSLLTLADIPWLIDDTVEPGVVLRYCIS